MAYTGTPAPIRPSGWALKGRYNRKGSIIILVLGIIALLSYMLMAFAEEASSKIKYYGLFYNRDDLRVYAYSGLEASLAVINEIREIDRGLWAPVQGWGNPLEYTEFDWHDPDVKIEATVEDETARFPLAVADELVLNAAFQAMGLELSEYEILTHSLMDWMDEDNLELLNGAEEEYYLSLDDPYKPPNAPLESWQELRLINGFREVFFDEAGRPNQYHRFFTNTFSLYNQESVNINTASGTVLNVLEEMQGIDSGSLQLFLRGEDGLMGTYDDQVITNSDEAYLAGADGLGKLVGYDAKILKVTVTAQRGAGTFLLTAIVSWSGGNPTAQSDARRRRVTGRRVVTSKEKDAGESLGYPFEIIRLVENVKI